MFMALLASWCIVIQFFRQAFLLKPNAIKILIVINNLYCDNNNTGFQVELFGLELAGLCSNGLM